VRVRSDFLRRYLSLAPTPLALERAHECALLAAQRFERPVLDIGCGDGTFASILFDEAVDLGIDPDRRELSAARRTRAYRELLPCLGSAIPRADGSFRTIFSNSVLEHIPDVEAVCREARRLLAPDGRFYATVPTDNFERYNVGHEGLRALGLEGAAAAWRGAFNSFWRHFHAYDRAGWTALFARCGLEVVEAREYCSRAVCLLNDALVPLAGGSFLLKKALNRWVVSPTARAPFAWAASRALEPLVMPEAPRGGLIFFHLRAAGVAS
jgi:SAM-dependent methyltransferase